MKPKSRKLERLIDLLRNLPGIGPISARRIAFRLLAGDERTEAKELAGAIADAASSVRHCTLCNTLCEEEVCPTCAAQDRDRSRLLVVETPADEMAVEASFAYKGLYFVLGGRLAPLDGVGPEDLMFGKLLSRIAYPELKEVILGTSFTSEGDVTAHFIAVKVSRIRPDIRVTRLSRGIPTGVELEYTDAATVSAAVFSRRAARPERQKPSPD